LSSSTPASACTLEASDQLIQDCPLSPSVRRLQINGIVPQHVEKQLCLKAIPRAGHLIKERIIEARLARRGRSSVPYSFFLDKIDLADKLLGIINKRTRDPRLLREARGQFVTSATTAFEVYFREMLRKSIDEGQVDIGKVPELEKERISVADLEWMKTKHVSAGELAYSAYNFQSLENINKVFSGVIGRDFISAVRERTYDCPIHGKERIREDFYERVRELVEARHTFVHEINFKAKYSTRQHDDRLDALVEFVTFADVVLEKH